jgi:hypothetical protein
VIGEMGSLLALSFQCSSACLIIGRQPVEPLTGSVIEDALGCIPRWSEGPFLQPLPTMARLLVAAQGLLMELAHLKLVWSLALPQPLLEQPLA